MDFKFTIDRVVELDIIPSTQDMAKTLADTYPGENLLIQATSQSAGHGRFDREWDAEEGGLYFSLLLRPKGAEKKTACLSVKAGEAVAKTLKEMYGLKTKIKLPNDVLALHKGEYKKIAGILIETSLEEDKLNWLVIGIGVNLGNNLCSKLKNTATTVKDITGQKPDVKEFRNALIKNFADNYIQWLMSKSN
ncbi:MAG: biotin--[acetyl-CoA-carboxylase] ligase [Elusimicrobiota bacterium]|jgi:BirA family biotin operon repressor/biotin-[acetyl-CoA-carboxylase] ligase|nr:biotin--[acetyl-CoA-carboxylase] ligase [Elusimicrobiota bacterium]